MEFTIEQLDIIKNKFIAIRDINSIVDFFSSCEQLLLDKTKVSKSKPISKKAISYYIYKKNNRYSSFQIRKKNGGIREINAPDSFLKKLQRYFNFAINLIFEPTQYSFGFIPNRNIVMNAKIHVAKRYVYNIDLKDFFSSTHFGRILAVLQIKPFFIQYNGAVLIANLVCENGILPQGAPSSPILTNIVCQRLDRKLAMLSKNGSFYYSRYADDITFSSNSDIFNDALRGVIKSIIEEEGYIINEEKERLQSYKQRQEVTGIVVNKKTNISRIYIKKIRAALYNWTNDGYEKANAKFAKLYINEKGFIRHKGQIPSLMNVLSGQIEYLGMVRGKEDDYFLNFKDQLSKLVNNE